MMVTKREQKENAGRTARALSLEISRGPANADLVTIIDPSDEYGWFQNFDSYGEALAFMVKAHRDKQDFGTPYPWVTWKEKRQKNPAPLALALTPKQYHDAKLRAIADEYGIELSEAREMYDTEGGRAENAAEWVKLVLDAANKGAELSRLTLDKFFELRPSAKLPESAIPNGYQRPEARKAERQRNPATKLPAKTADVRGAARRYMDFTGHAPGVVGEVNIKIPKAVAMIGTCDGILYTTVRDGKTERYIHEFKAADRPKFTVTPDGRGIFLVGGRYDFTDRGIVDASDPTSPRKRGRK